MWEGNGIDWQIEEDEDELDFPSDSDGELVDWRPSPGELEEIYNSLDTVLDYMKRNRVGKHG